MQSSVELTQQLVRFKTINPPGDESACAESLATLLEGAGFVVNVVPFGDGRAQLIAQIGGVSGKLPIGFTGHLDTVPLGAQPWSVDPLAAEMVDGKLYGRGSSDMKSGVAAFVSACRALADRLPGSPGVVLLGRARNRGSTLFYGRLCPDPSGRSATDGDHRTGRVGLGPSD